ncbi:hypothetical protein scyTo_0011520 [Scyliorhinus torazame]|uniref:Uncharacterized protein n=1 Tax=Scyliorhinus torazame TaxID=75743 RepID=A0A401NPL1_SCYTO|nr:hypothetical protein [Scyliorhinus torazame]
MIPSQNIDPERLQSLFHHNIELINSRDFASSITQKPDLETDLSLKARKQGPKEVRFGVMATTQQLTVSSSELTLVREILEIGPKLSITTPHEEWILREEEEGSVVQTQQNGYQCDDGPVLLTLSPPMMEQEYIIPQTL